MKKGRPGYCSKTYSVYYKEVPLVTGDMDFLTCYISLFVYRLLEKKLGEGFTCNQILETLCGINTMLLSKESGYIPSYKRTKLTDSLHSTFGFRTDFEFISKASMRWIISKTKKDK